MKKIKLSLIISSIFISSNLYATCADSDYAESGHTYDGVTVWSNGGAVGVGDNYGDCVKITTYLPRIKDDGSWGGETNNTNGIYFAWVANPHGNMIFGDGLWATTKGNFSDVVKTNGGNSSYGGNTIIIGNNALLESEGLNASIINVAQSAGGGSGYGRVIIGNDSQLIVKGTGTGVRVNLTSNKDKYNLAYIGNNAIIIGNGNAINSNDSIGYGVFAGNRDSVTHNGLNNGIAQGTNAVAIIGSNAVISTSGENAHAVYANKGGVVQLYGASITATGIGADTILAEQKVTTDNNNSELGGVVNLVGDLSIVKADDGYAMHTIGDNSIISSRVTNYYWGADEDKLYDGSGSVLNDSAKTTQYTQGVYQIEGNLFAESGLIDLRMTNNNTKGSEFIGYTKIGKDTNSLKDGQINLSIDGASSYWKMTNDSQLTVLTLTDGASLLAYDTNNPGAATYTITANSVSNGGVINLSDGTAGDKLIIKGNYISNGGVLKLDTELGDDSSTTDQLIVDGNITTGTGGSTKVVIENIGGQGSQTVEGIKVVSVINGTSSNDAFVKSTRIVAGAYDYNLVRGNISKTDTEGWYLTSYLSPNIPDTPDRTPEHMIRPEVGSYLGNLFSANMMFNLRLHDRLGETQYTDLLTGEKEVTSMWLRYQFSHNKFETSNRQLDVKSNTNIIQLGGDIAQWSSNGLNRLHIGLIAGYGHSTNNTDSKVTNYRSKGKIDGYSLGIYGTWYDNNEDKTGFYVDSWLLWNDFSASVKGDNLAKEKYDLSGFTAAIESGYTFLAKDYENYSIWLQPKGQLTWMGVSADNHTERNGTRVKGNDENLQVRLGGRVTISTNENYNLYNNKLGQIFVETNWIYNTQPFEVKLDDVKVKQKGARNIAEIKLGAEGDFYKNTTLWTNAAYQAGNNSYENIIFMVGGKYSF